MREYPNPNHSGGRVRRALPGYKGERSPWETEICARTKVRGKTQLRSPIASIEDYC